MNDLIVGIGEALWDVLPEGKTLGGAPANFAYHGSRSKTVYDLADYLGKSYNYLCRASSLTEEVPFPLELAVHAMKFMGNYDLLKLIATECGFTAVKLPKVAMKKGEENELAANYQAAASSAVKSLVQFIQTPTESNYNAVIESLNNIISESVAVKKYCEKKASRQLELDF